MARLGYAAIVLGNTPKPMISTKYLINKDGVTFSVDNSLRMLGNYDTVEKLKGEYGDKVAFITIGPAGEMKLGAASIACTDMELRPTRHAGRGGGRGGHGIKKGSKAIILDDSTAHMRTPKDPESSKKQTRSLSKG